MKNNETKMSIRGIQWRAFSMVVEEHINNYTVPQYGDFPDDYVEAWTPEECVLAIGKYVRRFNNPTRPGQQMLDMKKIAHFAQITYEKLAKMMEEAGEKDV